MMMPTGHMTHVYQLPIGAEAVAAAKAVIF